MDLDPTRFCILDLGLGLFDFVFQLPVYFCAIFTPQIDFYTLVHSKLFKKIPKKFS
jgi:hypothetical protein